MTTFDLTAFTQYVISLAKLKETVNHQFKRMVARSCALYQDLQSAHNLVHRNRITLSSGRAVQEVVVNLVAVARLPLEVSGNIVFFFSVSDKYNCPKYVGKNLRQL